MITVSPMGEVAVKAGVLTPLKIIDNFVNANKDWIEKQQQFFAQKYHTRIITTKAEIDSKKKAAVASYDIFGSKICSSNGC